MFYTVEENKEVNILGLTSRTQGNQSLRVAVDHFVIKS